jgi:hypothetical protein
LDGTAHVHPPKNKGQQQQQQQQKPRDSNNNKNTDPSSPSTNEALLRLILLEQRTNFEKINYALTKLNNTLDSLSSVIASIIEEEGKKNE